jgi:hypothetical protein
MLASLLYQRNGGNTVPGHVPAAHVKCTTSGDRNRRRGLTHADAAKKSPRCIDVRAFKTVDSTGMGTTSCLRATKMDTVEGTDRGLLSRTIDTVLVSVYGEVGANDISGAVGLATGICVAGRGCPVVAGYMGITEVKYSTRPEVWLAFVLMDAPLMAMPTAIEIVVFFLFMVNPPEIDF